MDSGVIIGNAMDEVLTEEFAAYIDDLPLYTDHQFSKRHNRKMRKLIKRQRKPYFKLICTAGRRAACIVAAVLVLSASALSVRAVRNAVFDFITKIFSDHNAVTTESGTDTGYPTTIEEEYYISRLPNGFEEMDNIKNDNMLSASYFKNENYIFFTQTTKSEHEKYFDNEHTDFERITDDNGQEYMLIITENDVTFIWDNGSYILQITSNLDKEEVMDLCKSTKIKK